MRFSLGLLAIMALAVVVGVLAAHTQTGTAAPPAVATVAPTSFPVPEIDHVAIYYHPGGNPVAVFTPATLTLHVGEEVTWENHDSQDHSAVADNGIFNSDVIGPGQTYRWTATKPGTFQYGCFIHPDMRGTIIVQP